MLEFPPPVTEEGAGKTGCALHPRSRVRKAQRKCTRAYRFSGGIRPSLRNGLMAYAALSLATNSSCHHHRRIEGSSKPGRARKTSADLTPATGARTTRFCRTRAASTNPRPAMCCRPNFSQGVEAPFVHASGECSQVFAQSKARPAILARDDAAASTASHPNVRDDRDTPPVGDKTAGIWM